MNKKQESLWLSYFLFHLDKPQKLCYNKITTQTVY